MNNICGVEFKSGGKLYNFSVNGLDLKTNDYVIVDTEKGLQYAKVIIVFEGDTSNVKSVVRVATAADKKTFEQNLVDASKTLKKARNIAEELKLEMNIIDASYTFDRKQLLFTYVADSRVDFRELAKRLAGAYKTRIELHQIGPRDKAKEVSGLGVCGRQLCCVKVLSHIDSVSMNMAKNQGLALNPNKINGACGRLLCCLAFEDEVYTECQFGLPSVGQTVDTPYGSGKVISVDILKRKYNVNIDGDVKTIEVKNDKK